MPCHKITCQSLFSKSTNKSPPQYLVNIPKYLVTTFAHRWAHGLCGSVLPVSSSASCSEFKTYSLIIHHALILPFACSKYELNMYEQWYYLTLYDLDMWRRMYCVSFALYRDVSKTSMAKTVYTRQIPFLLYRKAWKIYVHCPS